MPPISQQIDLWRATFRDLDARRAEWRQLLSADEIARAERFIDPGVRARFICGRGMLRAILGDLTGSDPAALRFAYGPRGKPALSGGDGVVSDLVFNLAHSGDVLLLAVGRAREIGVDVEHVRPLPHLRTMARDNFSDAERAALFELPESERNRAFFRCWTRKEAYIKARGDGFALPLTSFDVTLESAGDARLLRIDDDDPVRWTLHHLEPYPDYIGALCTTQPPPILRWHDFV